MAKTFESSVERPLAGLLAAFLLAAWSVSALAQSDHVVVTDEYQDGDAATAIYALQTPAELQDLVGPIALYPDDLISIILPAATYPVQIVQAARFLEQREGNPELQPPDDWDDAVVALLNYPEVIELMNDDLDWTWALGEAFLNQQADVLVAVTEFRDQAYAAGNLRTDEHQVVRRTENVIYIEPADPEVIYVPYYEPARVIVYQPYPAYFYHPYPRYSYYYPYPADYGFSFGYFFGVTTAYRLHWVNHHLYTYHYGYHRHPYYGRSYYNRFYFRHRPYRRHHPRLAHSRGGYRDDHRGDIWKPRRRHGPGPRPGIRSSGRDLRHPGTGGPGRHDGQRIRPRDASQSRLAAGTGNRARDNDPRRSFSDRDARQRQLIRRYREDAQSSARHVRQRPTPTAKNGDRLTSDTRASAARHGAHRAVLEPRDNAERSSRRRDRGNAARAQAKQPEPRFGSPRSRAPTTRTALRTAAPGRIPATSSRSTRQSHAPATAVRRDSPPRRVASQRPARSAPAGPAPVQRQSRSPRPAKLERSPRKDSQPKAHRTKSRSGSRRPEPRRR